MTKIWSHYPEIIPSLGNRPISQDFSRTLSLERASRRSPDIDNMVVATKGFEQKGMSAKQFGFDEIIAIILLHTRSVISRFQFDQERLHVLLNVTTTNFAKF